MKKANFNTLKNLPVPDGWMEKALAIPEAQEKKALVPLWRRKGAVALAASILLVTAVSAAIFLSVGRSPVTVKPSATESTAYAPTERVDGSAALPEQTVKPTSAATEAGAPTEGVTSPPASTEPTQSAPTQSGAAPSQAPAAKPTSPAEEPTVPAVAPTRPQTPTQTPWIPPTTAPTQTTIWEPPTELPSEPTWENPTEAPERLRTITTTIPRGSLPSDKKVYCRITLSDGTVLGDYGIFAKEREMIEYGSHLYSYNVYRNISAPVYKGVPITCYIYDSSGNILTESYYLDYY